jgi:tRNA 2-thiouridine synthesizing protein A
VTGSSSRKRADRILDCIGLYCPMPVMRTNEEMDKLAVGETLEVLADDSAAEEDLKAWAKRTGHKLIKIEKTSEGIRFVIKKTK